jgi:hypothetical protein
VICKLLTAPGSDPHVNTHLLWCLEVLASPAADPQAVAVCEGFLAAKPPLLPWLLKQLELSGGAAGVAAAALGKQQQAISTRLWQCTQTVSYRHLPHAAAAHMSQCQPPDAWFVIVFWSLASTVHSHGMHTSSMRTAAYADRAGFTAAGSGVLRIILGCTETRPAVCRIMAGWNQQPLVAALTSQQVHHGIMPRARQADPVCCYYRSCDSCRLFCRY